MNLDFLQSDLLPLIIALAVVVVAFVFRRPLTKLIIRFTLTRLHKRNAERYQLVRDCLIKPISYMLVTGVARVAIEYMDIPGRYHGVVSNILSSLFMVTAFWTLYAAAGLAVAIMLDSSREREESRVNITAANYVSGAIRIAIVIIGVLMVLSRWVSDISGLIAGLGIGGLAIALAAQDTASNLFGSISIMLDKPFEIGDWVEADGIEGTVEQVGLRSSRIRAMDRSIITMPNSKLSNSTISNGTKRVSRQISFTIGVVYATPAESMSGYIEKIKEILKSDPDVEDDGILVCFENFADSALEIFVSYYTVVNYTAMMLVKERVNFALLQAAEEAGVSMAFPSVSIYREK